MLLLTLTSKQTGFIQEEEEEEETLFHTTLRNYYPIPYIYIALPISTSTSCTTGSHTYTLIRNIHQAYHTL